MNPATATVPALTIDRKLLRTKGDRFCEVAIKLTDGRLSICGTEGRIETRSAAKREALEGWVSFFEDQPEEIASMNERCGTRFRSARSAAKYVIDSDGELHGLDVHSEDGNAVLLIESCGQIRREIAEWFPEVEPLLKWHLNDMKAECEHQEARGETYATHPDRVCSDCGYRLGSGWKRREVPVEIARLAAEVGA